MSLAAKSNWCFRWMKTLEQIRCVESEADLERFLDRLGGPERPETLAFVNAHAMNCVAALEEFGSALWNANMVVRDGSGMSILLKGLKRPPGLNLNGTDLIPQIIGRYNGRCIALFGTRDPYLGKADEKLRRDLAPASQTVLIDGFQSNERYIELACLHRPALIVLGMGMPKQEQVAALLRDRLEHPCLIVCGGAIIDFLGDRVARAPAWMRKSGVEWAYRLMQEPRRLFERYVLGNPLFLLRSMHFRRERYKWRSM